ncbi:DUF6479 family protein [Streptomyces sp. NBC_00306]|uniref:DUF6479 family protein n=1 Tax=Streptomyces sp. NBC_00306 TaxID=2975708 RepID=UPI002E2BCED7|nr:DUF6479 family protein [Streptomyces sp. NBC_00306]
MSPFLRPADDGHRLAAGDGAPAVIVFVLIAAALLVLLVGVVWRVGARRGRARPPRPEEQPRRPAQRSHVEARREPEDFGADGERLTPHELGGYGNQGSRPAPGGRRRDADESGGSFGSGGLGG